MTLECRSKPKQYLVRRQAEDVFWCVVLGQLPLAPLQYLGAVQTRPQEVQRPRGVVPKQFLQYVRQSK